ncbi:MAG: hypothetical protein ACO37V_01430 [Ilumatobacteraceae bacterium]
MHAGDAQLHPRVAAAWVQPKLQEAESNLALFAAMRTSQPSAKFMPAPTAAPFTAAIVGSGLRATRKKPS